MSDKPSKSELEAQVADESEKRTAKKDAQEPSEVEADLVTVVMLGAGRDAGARRKVTPKTAARLVRQRHADLA